MVPLMLQELTRFKPHVVERLKARVAEWLDRGVQTSWPVRPAVLCLDIACTNGAHIHSYVRAMITHLPIPPTVLHCSHMLALPHRVGRSRSLTSRFIQ